MNPPTTRKSGGHWKRRAILAGRLVRSVRPATSAVDFEEELEIAVPMPSHRYEDKTDRQLESAVAGPSTLAEPTGLRRDSHVSGRSRHLARFVDIARLAAVIGPGDQSGGLRRIVARGVDDRRRGDRFCRAGTRPYRPTGAAHRPVARSAWPSLRARPQESRCSGASCRGRSPSNRDRGPARSNANRRAGSDRANGHLGVSRWRARCRRRRERRHLGADLVPAARKSRRFRCRACPSTSWEQPSGFTCYWAPPTPGRRRPSARFLP